MNLTDKLAGRHSNWASGCRSIASVDGLWALANRTAASPSSITTTSAPASPALSANSRYVLGYASSYKRRDRVYRDGREGEAQCECTLAGSTDSDPIA
jgi:hypothetical protein